LSGFSFRTLKTLRLPPSCLLSRSNVI
jgi:hypothetical protein